MARVTVIVPNYNHARYLDARLRSIFEQSYRDFEVLLLDDASTDGSPVILADWAQRHSCRYLRNEQNTGSPFAQWNKGVSAADSEYVWMAESDDIAEPQLLATLVQRLDAAPQAVLAYAQSWVIDSEGQRTGDMQQWTHSLSPQRWQADFTADGSTECVQFLSQRNTIPNASAVLFRRRAFLAAGGACESLRLCGDWLTWARLLQQGQLLFVAQHLNHFRQHQRTVRASTSAVQFHAEHLQVTEYLLQHFTFTPQQLRQTRRTALSEWWTALRQGSPLHLSQAWPIIHTARHLGASHQLRMLFWQMMSHLRARVRNIA